MKKGLIFWFILFTTFTVRAQNYYVGSSEQTTQAEEIRLDLSTNYFSTILNKTVEYKKLKHLTFTNSSDKPISFQTNSPLSAELIYTLEFDNISLNDFTFIRNLARNVKAINTIIIRNTKIESIPMEFIFSKGVKTLIIENCKTLNPTSLNAVFSERSFLRTLRIVNCEIYSLENIFPRNNFSVIDLRNNHLSSAGDKLYQIKGLDSVFISGNFIPSPIDDLMWFSKSRVRYVEADSISVAAHTKLREACKNTQWHFVAAPSTTEKTSKRVFGQFTVNASKYKVYSSAYLQYDRLFSNAQFFVNLDTASLDEVFWDTLNLLARQTPIALNSNAFRLFKGKNIVRKHITFGFNKDRRGINTGYYAYGRANFYKSHSEMIVYKKYHWVTSEPMSSKSFRHFSRMDFVDLRLVYDGVGKSYLLYLKRKDGKIIALKVFPAKGKGKRNIRKNNDKYASDYARYLAYLSKKNRRHDKDIAKTKRRVYAGIEQAKRNAWNNLRSYMSPIEREMTKEEWMDYFFDLLKYEEAALLAAYPDDIFLQRKLRKMGFTYQGINRDTAGLVTISVFFTDEGNSNIPVDKIVVLNKSRMTYKNVYVTSYFGSIDLTLYKDDDLAFLVFMPDKSVGLVTIDEIEPSLKNNINTRIKSQIVSSELITIGQVLKKFDL